MKNLRMTAEELNALEPSYENPITLECDDGGYTNSLKKIKAISPVVNGTLAAISNDGKIVILGNNFLENYPSFKKEKKLKKFYQFTYRTLAGRWIVSSYLVDENFCDPTGQTHHENRDRKLMPNNFIEVGVEE